MDDPGFWRQNSSGFPRKELSRDKGYNFLPDFNSVSKAGSVLAVSFVFCICCADDLRGL
jgi:hypothetical protein